MFAVSSGSLWLNHYYQAQFTIIDSYNKITQANDNYLLSRNSLELQAKSLNDGFTEEIREENKLKEDYYENYFNYDFNWIDQAVEQYQSKGVDVLSIAKGYGFKTEKNHAEEIAPPLDPAPAATDPAPAATDPAPAATDPAPAATDKSSSTKQDSLLNPISTTKPDTFTFNIIKGNKKKNILRGTLKNDKILGYSGADKIFGRAGDDVINPGIYKKGKFDIIKGGKGKDTFIIKDNYRAYVKDFDIAVDNFDFSGLAGGINYSWEMSKRMTYVYDEDDDLVLKLKGKINISKADIV